MSEEKLDNQDDLKGGSRRSRKDQQGRDYICGCGKKYLSYPALYTHIKTKHEGHQPEGTQKTGQAPLKSRVKQKLDEKLLKEIHSWVSLQDLKILDLLDENARGCISASNRMKRDAIGRQIWSSYNQLVKNPSLNLDHNSFLDKVLVVYLLGVGQYVSQPMFHCYCQFGKFFSQCFTESIDEVLANALKGCQMPPFSGQCKMAPILCDYFLRFFFLNSENQSEDFLSIMKILTFDFCRWMYEKKLSPVEINLNLSYELPRRDMIQPKIKEKKGESKVDKEEDKEDSLDPQQSSPDSSDKKNSELDHRMQSIVSLPHEEFNAGIQEGEMIEQI